MKRRYFIRDLEEMLGVKRKTYFYWEKTGKVPKSKRTPMGNYRYWTGEDIDKIRKIIGG